MFQSTHPCGVRHRAITCAIRCACFNPRTRVGCDNLSMFSSIVGSVSIHAPVWGATDWVVFTRFSKLFQSTHPCGVRHLKNICQSVSSSFNPRTRVGCDGEHRLNKEFIKCFNPRTRVGCDGELISQLSNIQVSIHAPVWGATDKKAEHGYHYEFQSTHPCGVRPGQGGCRARNNSFNPRTRVGCD